MSTFAFLVLCIQACLFQNVYSCPAKSPAVASVCNLPTCAPACVPTCAPTCTPVYAAPACAPACAAPACTPVCALPACTPVYAASATVTPCAYTVSTTSSCGCGGRYY